MNFLKNFRTKRKLQELNNRENELFEAIMELLKTDRSKSSLGFRQNDIFDKYSDIHSLLY